VDLDPRALATLSDVKEWMQIDEAEMEEDDWFIERLNAASSLLHECTNREIVAENAVWDANDSDLRVVAAVARTFDGEELERDEDTDWRWVLPVGDMAERPTRVRVLERDGTLVEDWQGANLTAYNVVDLPRRRAPWEPIAELRFEDRMVGRAVSISRAYVYEVTAKWGFPSVPSFVKEAAVLQVSLWAAKDLRHFSATFNNITGRVEYPRTLSPHVVGMVQKIKVTRV
jgi:hypothetical protein